MIKGFHPVGLTARNLDRLVASYRDLFLGEVVRTFRWSPGEEEFDARQGVTRSAGRLVMLRLGAASIEIIEFSRPAIVHADSDRSVANPGFSHVCLAVDDRIAEHEHRRAAGMDSRAPPLRISSGARFAFGRDSDNSIVEILEPPRACAIIARPGSRRVFRTIRPRPSPSRGCGSWSKPVRLPGRAAGHSRSTRAGCPRQWT